MEFDDDAFGFDNDGDASIASPEGDTVAWPMYIKEQKGGLLCSRISRCWWIRLTTFRIFLSFR